MQEPVGAAKAEALRVESFRLRNVWNKVHHVRQRARPDDSLLIDSHFIGRPLYRRPGGINALAGQHQGPSHGLPKADGKAHVIDAFNGSIGQNLHISILAQLGFDRRKSRGVRHSVRGLAQQAARAHWRRQCGIVLVLQGDRRSVKRLESTARRGGAERGQSVVRQIPHAEIDVVDAECQ